MIDNGERDDICMRVVIPDAHLPAALALIREFGEAGHEVWAVCEGGKPAIGLRSKYVARSVHMTSGLTRPGVREVLLGLLHGEDKPVFIPLSRETIELVSHRKSHFDLECRTLVPEPDRLSTAQDKRRIYKAARELGLKTPAERTFLSGEKIADFARRQPMPVVLKYYDGEKLFLPPQRRYSVETNASGLFRRYNTMHDVQSPVIVQDWVPGESWGVGLVLNRRHETVCVMCHHRVRQCPPTGGTGTLCRSVWLPEMVEAASVLASALKLEGFVYTEFRGKREDFTLVDVSPRAWHSMPLCRLSGLGIGLAYAEAAEDSGGNAGAYLRYDTGRELQFFLDDLRAGWSSRNRASWLFNAVRDGLKPSVNGSLWDKNDRGPAAAAFNSIIRQ